MPFDYAINFAALNVVAPSWDYPGHYVRVNVIETTRLFEFLINQRALQKFVQVSTPEVYGPIQGVINENVSHEPSTPYAVSRSAAERMSLTYQRRYGLPIVFTRACNIYGPGQQLHRLIPKLIVSIRKGETFKLEGGGASYRSFMHVRDMCTAYYAVMMNGEPPLAYNVSAQYLSKIRELVGLICRMMGTTLQDACEVAPERPGKDDRYHLNIDRIRALGWTDTTRLEDGIAEMIKWVDDNFETLRLHPTEYEIEL